MLLRCVQLKRVEAARSRMSSFDHLLGLVPLQQPEAEPRRTSTPPAPPQSSLPPISATTARVVSYDPEQRLLSVRVPLTPRLVWKNDNDNNGSSQGCCVRLSTYLALVDEVTTWALFEANPQQGRLGVSLSLSIQQTQLSPPTQWPILPKQVEVRAQLHKLGTTIAMLDATVVDSVSRQVLARASHTKFLSSMGRGTDAALSQRGWPWTTWWYGANQEKNDDKNETTSANQADTLQSAVERHVTWIPSSSSSKDFLPQAQFSTSRIWANGFGTLHGGAHATWVQAVAQEFVGSDAPMTSMHMEYHAAVALDQTVTVRVVHSDILSGQIQWVTVHVWDDQRDRLASTGVCQFLVDATTAAPATTTTTSMHSKL